MARALGMHFCFSSALVSAVMIAALPVVAASPALAQKAAKGQRVDGRKAVIAGIKAYEAGRNDTAISTLTKAIGAGGLSSTDLAKALYYRGMASSRSGKSAQAIADLTNAVWMKGGLTPVEQKKALETRAKAYAKVGIKDPGPPTASIGKPLPATSTPSVAKAAPARPAQKVATLAPAAGPKPSAPTPGGFQTSVNQGPGTSTPPPATSQNSGGTSNPLSGVGNFFSNLFGGGGSAPQAASPSTASINPAPAGNTTAVSAWSSQTAVTGGGSVANVTPKPAAPAKRRGTAKPGGRYKLQVAAVRSRDEAERLAGALRQKHAGQIGSRVPDISEKVFGNMGTFYQVNVGPYAKTSETDKVCRVLKADGFDCLVVKK
ncbi:MAG: SPOR domain-containing protein [Alphaproteobacteria bacterium]|nr:SPOR domain-containing protein [Alphaproteobacteria bacterium]